MKTEMGKGTTIPKGRFNLPRETKAQTKDRILVFAEGRQAEEAKKAGADIVGTSQVSEMELRIPSSPSSVRKPSGLRLEMPTFPAARTHGMDGAHVAISPQALFSSDDSVPTSQVTQEKEITSTPQLNHWPPGTPPSKRHMAAR